MNPILNTNIFIIKEKLGIFKASNSYDIFDAVSNKQLLTTKEDGLGFFTKIFRFTEYKRHTPFNVVVTLPEGKPIVSIKRGISIFKSTVEVFDENNKPIGFFKQHFWSFGGKFEVLDAQEKHLCNLEGKWTGWDYKFNKDNQELAHVSKKWAGIGKEFFTSADNYVLEIKNTVPENASIRPLILAAVMCIDMVLKEK